MWQLGLIRPSLSAGGSRALNIFTHSHLGVLETQGQSLPASVKVLTFSNLSHVEMQALSSHTGAGFSQKISSFKVYWIPAFSTSGGARASVQFRANLCVRYDYGLSGSKAEVLWCVLDAKNLIGKKSGWMERSTVHQTVETLCEPLVYLFNVSCRQSTLVYLTMTVIFPASLPRCFYSKTEP